MNFYDVLKEIALTRYWANPHADSNSIFKTVRLSAARGDISKFTLDVISYNLPDDVNRYMLYTIGNVSPTTLGIRNYSCGWELLEERMSNAEMLLYAFIRGRMAILKNSYFCVMDDGSVLFALDYQKNSSLELTDDLYIKFYSNVYYESPQQTLANHLTFNHYEHSGVFAEYLSFSLDLTDAIKNTIGHPFIYYNGLILPDGLLDFNKLQIGDKLEYIVDPMIIDKYDLPIDLLNSFSSKLDGTEKVIASIDSPLSNVYVDDIEFFVSGIRSDGTRIGAYFPRLNEDVIRMLTFKDWSLSSLLLEGRLDELRNFIEVSNVLSAFTLHIYRRENKQQKPIILDPNRIADLMNLPLGVRIEALSGVNSTVSIWQASALENCKFNQWVSCDFKNVYSFDITGLYAREGAIEVIESVHKPDYGTSWLLPPMANSDGGVLISYDNNGVNPTFTHYDILNHANAPYVNGTGTEIFLPNAQNNAPLDTILPANDNTVLTVPIGFGIFCYYYNGNELIYAVDGQDYTLADNGTVTTITWNSSLIKYERYVRESRNYVMYNANVSLSDIRAGINVYGSRPYAHHIGMETLWVWYNGRYMVEGLDYVLHNGLLFLLYITPQAADVASLSVIYVGLPTKELTHKTSVLWNWIKSGTITENTVYDLMMYRNKLFFINGMSIPFSMIKEAEGYVDKIRELSSFNIITGMPYAIVDKPTFSRTEYLDNYTETKLGKDVVDKEIVDFITAIYPQVVPKGLYIFPSKYDLVSPLMDKLIVDILSGSLIIPNIELSNEALLMMLVQYQDCLNYDPCLMNHDLGFVEIHPCWTSEKRIVNLVSYNFLSRVNSLVLKNNVIGLNLYLLIQG